MPVTEDVLVERNVVMHNNRPNPVLPSEDVVGVIPTGTGILTMGADRVIMRDNRVLGNDSGGIAVLALAFPNPDPRVDPLPDGNQARSNVALANGHSPDPRRSPFSGSDLIYDGTGNCFADKASASSIPTALELILGCDSR